MNTVYDIVIANANIILAKRKSINAKHSIILSKCNSINAIISFVNAN
jgi:hypothetical protein